MRPWLGGVIVLAWSSIASAQCEPDWAKGLELLKLSSNSTHVLAQNVQFRGEELTVLGLGRARFEFDGSNPDQFGPFLWDGEALLETDGGLQGTAPAEHAAAMWTDPVTHEDSIIVAGAFTEASGAPVMNIARWDGAQWHSVGGSTSVATTNGVIRALAVADLGDGPYLYAGGDFTRIGGVTANRLARWNGGAWEPVGGGLSSRVRALRPFDFGEGPTLVVAGDFTLAAGSPAPYIACWDGAAWTAMNGGVAARALDVQSIASPGGPTLYATGRFVDNGRVARWNGASWVVVGPTLLGEAETVAMINLLGTPTLVAVGLFTSTPTSFDFSRVAALQNGAWALLAPSSSGEAATDIARMTDPETGDELHFLATASVSGTFSPSEFLVSPTGQLRSSIGRGLPADLDSIASFDDGLNAGAPTVYANGVVRFVDGEWRLLAMTPNREVEESLGAAPGGGPEKLFVVGRFDGTWPHYGPVTPARGVAMFDGVAWSALGQGIEGEGVALAAGNIDGVEKVFVGAMIDAGDEPRPAVYSWDGQTLVELAGLEPDGRLRDLIVVEDNGATMLLAAGSYLVGEHPIVRWDGDEWVDFGYPYSSNTIRLAAVHEPGGLVIYAEGPGHYPDDISRFDGKSWTGVRLLPELPPYDYYIDIFDMKVFDDGAGEAAYCVGDLRVSGEPGQQPFFARMDADGLHLIAHGDDFVAAFGAYEPHDEQVRGLAPLTRGEFGEPLLMVSGDFTSVSGVGASYLAGWRAAYPLPGDIDGDNLVGMEDLMRVVEAFNTSAGDGGFDAAADLDGDGTVGFADLNLVVSNFHSTCR